MLKARLVVQDPGSGLDVKEALPALSDVLAFGLEDKIAQVFMTSLGLLEALLEAGKAARLKRSQVRASVPVSVCVFSSRRSLSKHQNFYACIKVGPLLEPVISILVAKLGDGQGRIRNAALAGLLRMAK